uniref:carboxylesterase 5A n=1 Tax=Jaculus jaculus TaxID=51337 RepID=UPI001E1B135F|nr:carboxylesterase 5A [Jaculus jaculus]
MSGDGAHLGQGLIWTIWIFETIVRGEVPGTANEAPHRNTMLGWVKGKQTTVQGSSACVNVFLGIPFAAPPVGPLRFASPQPAIPWEDVRDATTYPALCFQNTEWIIPYQKMLKVQFPKFSVSEDCLYLNIYAPVHAKDGSKLPVMVWIPGGSFQTGTASLFDGSALVAYENVLVVSIQYRLGIFGFFSTQNKHASGNWGFKDQMAALFWVQENIKFFGGNPASVTIFGESAGAVSVSSLVLSPMSRGLFHRAIMQSGVAINPCLRTFEEELKSDLQIIANVCQVSDVSNSDALLKCLRAKSAEDLLKLSQKTNSFTRVVDGSFYSNDPLKLLSQKNFKNIPCIIGVNNQECGYLLVMEDVPQIVTGINKSFALNLVHKYLHVPSENLPIVDNEYFQDKVSLSDIRDNLLDMFGDVLFVVPGIVTARHHRDAGAPVYFYEFQHRPQCFNYSRPSFVKADHTDEIRFVFGAAFLTGDIVMFEDATAEEKLLSKKMMKYWANFARRGNPNGEGVPQWPVYNGKEPYLMLNLNISVGQKLKEQRVGFWTDILPLTL